MPAFPEPGPAESVNLGEPTRRRPAATVILLRDSTEGPELLDGWCRLLGDDDPEKALFQALSDAAGWQESLLARALPYPESGASEQIVAELDARLDR